MCTHYKLNRSSQSLADLFEAAQSAVWDTVGLEGPQDFYPDQIAPVIGYGRRESEQESGLKRILGRARWGLPAPAHLQARNARPIVNIRNLQSPFWRTSLTRKNWRCLVPVDAFAEWSADIDPVSKRKTRHFFRLKSQATMAFAGILQPVAGDLPRFAFLTCEPNALVGAIHPKAMPVILPPDRWEAWMQGVEATQFQVSYPDAEMERV